MFPYYFSKLHTYDWLSDFSKAELRFPILFEVPPEFKSDAASCKISRISKCFQRSKQELKKYFFLAIKMQKKFSWHWPFKNILIRVRPFNTDPSQQTPTQSSKPVQNTFSSKYSHKDLTNLLRTWLLRIKFRSFCHPRIFFFNFTTSIPANRQSINQT